jgi:putative hydroxymethylpyrimidine transport system substrate-binding protein
LAAFVGVLERSVQYLINHPEESWRAFISYKKGLDDELNKRAWRDTLPRFALRPAALDIGRYERFASFVMKRGLAKKMPPVANYAVVVK